MDVFVLKAIVDELHQQLHGATVSKVFQMSRDDLLLRLWRGKDMRLVLSTHPTLQRLHLTTNRFENPQRPPRFAAFLRAHLKHTRLRDITVRPYDRVVHITWERPGDTEPSLTLLHELTGRQANVLLLHNQDVILDALTHVQPHAMHHRTILPGHQYHPLPLPSQRLLISDLTLDHLTHLHRQGMLTPAQLHRLLIGVSPVLLTELVYRSQGEPQACWALVQQLRRDYDNSALSLSISTTSEGVRHLSVLPLTHCAVTVESFQSPQEAAAQCYDVAVHAGYTDSLRRDTDKLLRQRRHKLEKKIANLQHDYDKLQSYLPYQHYGTLLVSQRLPRGTSSATVIDYYQPGQPTITIPLDPRLSVHDNAQVYFKRYRKAKSGLAKVQALLNACTAEARHLDAWAEQLAHDPESAMLYEITEHLSGPPRSTTQKPDTRGHTEPALPYRTFVSRDGYTLYCGKSNRGNDVLLRQVAAPDDVWLHAHQQAGAHVLIEVQPPHEVPQQTLLDAAALAGFYSKGRHAVAVEVIYTQVKHVRKFRGAQPGQVQVTNYRTLEVAPGRPVTADDTG